jgi:hypothetical protein
MKKLVAALEDQKEIKRVGTLKNSTDRNPLQKINPNRRTKQGH